MKLFLTGGFLGSGKTTAIKSACLELIKKGLQVAVITNDQGDQLVDTGFIESFGIPAKQVVNGCFCCNYDKLTDSIFSWSEREQPEVIFAESVGSCTDLIATIAKPLARFYPRIKVVISVFADASLMLKLADSSYALMKDEVYYIHQKQLAEADILIINKVDLLDDKELQILRNAVLSKYPLKAVLYQNSLDPHDVRLWLATMDNLGFNKRRNSLELDYDTYARGEAMLAWHNEALNIFKSDGDAYEVAIELIEKIESEIRLQGYLIGHLKFLIDDGDTKQKISYTAIGGAGKDIIPAQSNTGKVSVLINARVQAEPSQLKGIISNAIKEIIEETNCRVDIGSLSSFKPGYPKPTHRIFE